jgi:hypothetical protein
LPVHPCCPRDVVGWRRDMDPKPSGPGRDLACSTFYLLIWANLGYDTRSGENRIGESGRTGSGVAGA